MHNDGADIRPLWCPAERASAWIERKPGGQGGAVDLRRAVRYGVPMRGILIRKRVRRHNETEKTALRDHLIGNRHSRRRRIIHILNRKREGVGRA